MAVLTDFQIPPPSKWQDFEDLCLDTWRNLWRDPNAQKNGRQGQPQNGVDIFGRPDGGSQWAGIQCKSKNNSLSSTLTYKELLAEVEKAKKFKPQLASFAIAFTGPRDADLQAQARLLTEAYSGVGLFSVHLWCWEDILQLLAKFPEVISRHFPGFVPIRIFSPAHISDGTICASDHQTLGEAEVPQGFKQPSAATTMHSRPRLCRDLEKLIATERSVYLNAPSGFGKSVLLSQLSVPNLVWIDCEDNHTDFQSFRSHLAKFVRRKHHFVILPDSPREVAAALDECVRNSSKPQLVLALDHVDNVDAGVKAFIEELITSATNVRVIMTGSKLRLKRQQRLEASGRLSVMSAADLAFNEEETVAVLTLHQKGNDSTTSAEFAHFVHEVTCGWPIAVQLIRMRLEREPDETTAARYLANIAKLELGSYLLESYWTVLDDAFKSLLTATALFRIFDQTDAQAIVAMNNFAALWEELTALPFVTRLPGDEKLLVFQPLFRSFLAERLTSERTQDELRAMNRSAALHFIESKSIPPAAYYHALKSEQPEIIARAAGEMAEYAYLTGNYVALREVVASVPPSERWNGSMLAVYQGRLYEHDRNWSSALKWYQRARELFESQGPEQWSIGITNDIGGILRQTGKLDEAVALYDTALGRLPSHEPSFERAQFLANRANALLAKSLTKAEEDYLRAKEIFQLNRDIRSLAMVYLGLAEIESRRDHLDLAFKLRVKATKLSKQANDSHLFLTASLPVGQELIRLGKIRAAHKLYKEAFDSAVASDSVGEFPLVLNNFGLACAFLPEPDPSGVNALLAALEMKNKAGIRWGGTAQNLTTLLMRLGRFDEALQFAREQVRFAEQSNDVDLALDGKAKVLELESLRNKSTGGTVSPAEPGSNKHYQGAKRLVVEGRLRSALRQRWPLLDNIIAGSDDNRMGAVVVGQTPFYIRDAQNVLFLIGPKTDIRETGAGGPTTESSPGTRQNLILEMISSDNAVSQRESPAHENELAAIWYIHDDEFLWIQTFWHSGQRSDKSDKIVGLNGCLFSLDPSSGKWLPNSHGEDTHSQPDIHKQFLRCAADLIARFSIGTGHHPISISGRNYTVVA